MSYTEHCNDFTFNFHHLSKLTCLTSSCTDTKSLCSHKYDRMGNANSCELWKLNKTLRSDCLHSDSAISDVTTDCDVQ
jgi:hypothetical protein